MDNKQKKQLLSYARESIRTAFLGEEYKPKKIPKILLKKLGAFVTLHVRHNNALRGCIGITAPIMPLYECVVKCARSSAFEDTRFMPLSMKEFEDIRIEISVLSKPTLIKEKGNKILEKINIGKDGLIIEYLGNSGLLLPQVAVEENYTAKTFVEMSCWKAGVPKNSYLRAECKIYKFQADVFSE